MLYIFVKLCVVAACELIRVGYYRFRTYGKKLCVRGLKSGRSDNIGNNTNKAEGCTI